MRKRPVRKTEIYRKISKYGVIVYYTGLSVERTHSQVGVRNPAWTAVAFLFLLGVLFCSIVVAYVGPLDYSKKTIQM